LEQGAVPAGRRHGRAHVEGQGGAARQHGRLLQVAHPVGEDARRDDDEEVAGHPEEPGDVEADHAAVDRHLDRDRREDAEQGAHEGCRAAAGRLHGGPDEECGLDALAPDREEGQGDDRPGTADERPVEAGFELAAQAPRGPGHPEDHPGDEAHGHDRESAADDLLGLEGESVGAEGQHGAESEGEGDRGTDAEPEAGEDVTSADLDHVGDEDADHESGLEALPESDEVVGEHGDGFLGGKWSSSSSRGGSGLTVHCAERCRDGTERAGMVRLTSLRAP
jgi:hypothetical protein